MKPIRFFTFSFDTTMPDLAATDERMSPKWSQLRCAALCSLFFFAFGAVAELSAGYLFQRISRVRSRIGAASKKSGACIPDLRRQSRRFTRWEFAVRAWRLIPLLQRELAGYRVQRFVVSDTSYLDTGTMGCGGSSKRAPAASDGNNRLVGSLQF